MPYLLSAPCHSFVLVLVGLRKTLVSDNGAQCQTLSPPFKRSIITHSWWLEELGAVQHMP